MKTKYTVAFLFNPELTEVALIRKGADRGWQANKLNGIGGTVEDKDYTTASEDDAFLNCHLREYKEECGYDYPDQAWHRFATFIARKCDIAFYCGVGNIYACKTQPQVTQGREPEEVTIYPVAGIYPGNDDLVYALAFLIPLAIHKLQSGRPQSVTFQFDNDDTAHGATHEPVIVNDK